MSYHKDLATFIAAAGVDPSLTAPTNQKASKRSGARNTAPTTTRKPFKLRFFPRRSRSTSDSSGRSKEPSIRTVDSASDDSAVETRSSSTSNVSTPRTSIDTDDISRASFFKDPTSTFDFAFSDFITNYPGYDSPILDALRKCEYSRLDNPLDKHVYLDYTGSALSASSHVAAYGRALNRGVFGNPHSVNPASQKSSLATKKAKEALLRFVDADEDVYDVVWTANATAALKIVGDGFDFRPGQKLVLGCDSHNSVNGLRSYAKAAGADVNYLDLTEDGMLMTPRDYEQHLKGSQKVDGCAGLFVLTCQSNITGIKVPIDSLTSVAKRHGFSVLLDASAYLPSSPLSLRTLKNRVDAVGLSVYKIAGFPTGVGALVVRKDFLRHLGKRGFAGGSVDVVQAPGELVTYAEGAARFEDGTPNFLSMLAVPTGLDLTRALYPELARRLPTLVHWTVKQLASLLHRSNRNRQLVKVRSPSLAMSLAEVARGYGALVAFEVVDDQGEFVNCEAIEYGASRRGISIRAGCMCNPGGMAGITNLREPMKMIEEGMTKKDIQQRWGVRFNGILRASFGIANNFADCFALVEYLRSLTDPAMLADALEEHRRFSLSHSH